MFETVVRVDKPRARDHGLLLEEDLRLDLVTFEEKMLIL